MKHSIPYNPRPTCAVYAAYNEIRAGDKGIVHGIGMTHSCSSRLHAELDAWMRDFGPKKP